MAVTEPGYLFTEIDYIHPFDVSGVGHLSITAWFEPFGNRTAIHSGIDV